MISDEEREIIKSIVEKKIGRPLDRIWIGREIIRHLYKTLESRIHPIILDGINLMDLTEFLVVNGFLETTSIELKNRIFRVFWLGKRDLLRELKEDVGK